MHGSRWVRQAHRWFSIVFTTVSGSIFIALGLGHQPAQWIYFLPLVPLAVLTLSGLWMFFLPNLARRRAHHAAGSFGARPS